MTQVFTAGPLRKEQLWTSCTLAMKAPVFMQEQTWTSSTLTIRALKCLGKKQILILFTLS